MFELFGVTSPWPECDDERAVLKHKSRLVLASESLREVDLRSARIAASAAAMWELALLKIVNETAHERERRVQSAFELAFLAGDVDSMQRCLAKWSDLRLPLHRAFHRGATRRLANTARTVLGDLKRLDSKFTLAQSTLKSEDVDELDRLAREFIDEHGYPRAALYMSMRANTLRTNGAGAESTARELLNAAPLDSAVAIASLRVLLRESEANADLIEPASRWLQDPRLKIVELESHHLRWLKQPGTLPSESLMTEALAVARSLPPEWSSFGAYAFTAISQVLQSSGNEEEALRVIDEGIQLAPGNRYLSITRAQLLLDRGDFDAADDQLRRTQGADPAWLVGYVRGFALARAARWAEAVSPIQAALQAPATAGLPLGGLHNDLGVAFAKSGRVDEARAEFRRAVELLPDDIRPRQNLVLLEMDHSVTSPLMLVAERAQIQRVLTSRIFKEAA